MPPLKCLKQLFFNSLIRSLVNNLFFSRLDLNWFVFRIFVNFPSYFVRFLTELIHTMFFISLNDPNHSFIVRKFFSTTQSFTKNVVSSQKRSLDLMYLQHLLELMILYSRTTGQVYSSDIRSYLWDKPANQNTYEFSETGTFVLSIDSEITNMFFASQQVLSLN